MDSSESPTPGQQEGSAWNAHFGCTCYHPLFVFNQFGDLERCLCDQATSTVPRTGAWCWSRCRPLPRAGRRSLLPRRRGVRQARDLQLLEHEGIRYAIRLPANQVLQRRIGHLLTRPVGRPPKKPIVTYASFRYQAKGWTRARRVVAKVEWHQGELYPRVGFIVTNLTRPPSRWSSSITAAARPSSGSRSYEGGRQPPLAGWGPNHPSRRRPMPTNHHLVQSDTAIRSDVASIFVSLELSRSRWLVTSLSPGARRCRSIRSPAVTEPGCSIV